MGDVTVIAVDWSGAKSRSAQRRGIWVAVVQGGDIVESRGGWTREETVEFVARQRGRVLAGFDFSFGVPEWFARKHGCATVDEVWTLAAAEGERWLEVTEPFWRHKCNVVPERRYRACEERLRAAGLAPKSIFQLVGNGQVGAGSVRGMPLLRELREAGFAIWPFDAPADRIALEFYPTALADRKGSDQDDAERAALVMWEHRAQLAALRPTTDAVTRVEGDIWLPR